MFTPCHLLRRALDVFVFCADCLDSAENVIGFSGIYSLPDPTKPAPRLDCVNAALRRPGEPQRIGLTWHFENLDLIMLQDIYTRLECRYFYEKFCKRQPKCVINSDHTAVIKVSSCRKH
jgi:hypothetical protein